VGVITILSQYPMALKNMIQKSLDEFLDKLITIANNTIPKSKPAIRKHNAV